MKVYVFLSLHCFVVFAPALSTSMEFKEVSQEKNTLSVLINYSHPTTARMQRLLSPQYICGALYTEFEFASGRCMFHNADTADYNFTVRMRFKKILQDDDFTYICKIVNPKRNSLITELRVWDDHWHQVDFCNKIRLDPNLVCSITFEVTVISHIFEDECVFASLCDDTYLTDFKLFSKDGSVKIHKTVLAAHSPVFRAMLEGEWKESQEDSVELQGFSLKTLQHLKNYMYLNRLPETGLQELCVLANYYIMPRLVVQCCAKLLNHLTINNAIEVAEFASTHKLRPLFNAILNIGKKIDNKLSLKTNWPNVCSKSNNTTDNTDDTNIE